METRLLEITSGSAPTVVDLTSEIEAFCRDQDDGLLSVFVPHATAGVAIIERGAGSDLDLLSTIEEILPASPGKWRHDHGAPGHGRDHVLPAWISPSVTVPVAKGKVLLGTWQSIVLVDTNIDNPVRNVRLSFLAG